MIAFTCDVDWASEEIINDTLEIFEEFGVKCTLFSTHHSISLSKSNYKLFEFGIHPDFTPLMNGFSDKSAEDILDEMLDKHPSALGIRCHKLFQSTDLLQKFSDKKLLYESNTFLPYQGNLHASKLWNNLVRIPYNWEDEVHWEYGNTFEECKIDLTGAGLKVFDFHPVHIYLNTENKFRYNEAKKHFKNPGMLKNLRNNEVPGTRDLLKNLLTQCRDNNFPAYKLSEIAYDCLQINF